VVRAPCRSSQTSWFFATMASPTYARRDVELSLLPPTLCAFQLGGPTPNVTGSDVLCRPTAWPRAFLSRCRFLSVRRPRWEERPDQIRAQPVPVRAPCCLQTRTPSTGLDPTFRWGVPHREKRDRKSRYDSNTRSQCTEARLCHGDGRPHPATPSIPPRRSTSAIRGEDASIQPLQPTCCHEHPQELSIPKLAALAVLTGLVFDELPLEPTPELRPVESQDDAEGPDGRFGPG